MHGRDGTSAAGKFQAVETVHDCDWVSERAQPAISSLMEVHYYSRRCLRQASLRTVLRINIVILITEI